MNRFLLLVVALTVTSVLHAQRLSTFHVGLFGGTATYSGDFVEKPIDLLTEMSPAVGLSARYTYGTHFAARMQLTYGRISGSDLNAESNLRRLRNLRFRSPVVELALLPEYNIKHFLVKKSGYVITPFVYAGVAGFYFNPQAPYQNEWINLQPLGTEGQGVAGAMDKYSRFQIAVPAGLGVRFKVNEMLSIAWEAGLRVTFTDYLDDVGGVYPDMGIMAERGPIAFALSDRTAEYTGLPSDRQAGDLRGTDNNDLYLFSGFSVYMNLSKPQERM